MHWMILPYRRYAEFSGRSRRMEFWMYGLFHLIVAVAVTAIFGHTVTVNTGNFVSAATSVDGPGGIILGLFRLVSFVPSLAVSVRRLHDQGRSGWLLLLVLIPFLGWFALLVLMCFEGTHGANRYGPDPKDPGQASVFS